MSFTVNYIFQVIEFFTSRLAKAENQSGDVDQVLGLVKHAALQWPHDRLKVSYNSTLPYLICVISHIYFFTSFHYSVSWYSPYYIVILLSYLNFSAF